jgi:hypothetical protein
MKFDWRITFVRGELKLRRHKPRCQPTPELESGSKKLEHRGERAASARCPYPWWSTLITEAGILPRRRCSARQHTRVVRGADELPERVVVRELGR